MQTIQPIWKGAHQQAIYRTLLDAMSYPGKISDLTTFIGDHHACEAILACLADNTVSIADPQQHLDELFIQLLQTTIAPIEQADFVVFKADSTPQLCPPLNLGQLLTPEHNATLLLITQGLSSHTDNDGVQLKLNGPGIKTESLVCIQELDTTWIEWRARWNQKFPLGVDVFFTDRQKIMGLPRTTQIEVMN